MRNPFAIVSKACIDLIKQMLVKDPAQRITTQDALNHSFFNILGDLNTKGSPSVYPDVLPREIFIQNEVEEEKKDTLETETKLQAAKM
jgi:serine/threonine protein kinase